MAVDFPSSPTVGQTFTSGGVTWMWDGVKWTSTGAATGLYLPLAGGAMQGDLILNRDAQVALGAATKAQVDAKLSLVGVTNGSDALAGQIGEVISSVVASPGVTLTTAVNANVTSIALTAGDWDVQGEVWFAQSANLTQIQAGITPVSSVIPTSPPTIDRAVVVINATLTGGARECVGLRTCRVSLSAGATYYLVGSAVFASGTASAYGNIWARRVR